MSFREEIPFSDAGEDPPQGTLVVEGWGPACLVDIVNPHEDICLCLTRKEAKALRRALKRWLRETET